MKSYLDFHKSSKFKFINFDVKLPIIILMNVCLQTADVDVVNSDICFVASAVSNFADVFEIDDVDAFMFVLFVFVGAHAARRHGAGRRGI